jgi:triosephosphate isomerase
MRKPFIAGNWKMNMDSASAVALAAGLVKELSGVDTVDVAVCPPFVYLQSVAAALSASNIALGSQNVYFEEKGAFTGETSCAMLKDTSCSYAIIGHSECRHVMGETLMRWLRTRLKTALKELMPNVFRRLPLPMSRYGPLARA